MTAPPLTHHEIIALAEPFARSGRRVDLAATQRLERRVMFVPVELTGDGPLAGCREVLQLDSLGTGTLRLTRTLRRPDGAQATLQVAGSEAGELLRRVEAVAPQVHFVAVSGGVIARSYRLDWVGAAGARPGAPAPQPMALTQGVVAVCGLTLTLNVAPTRGVSADIVLRAVPWQPMALPHDLLGVLGWNWARLVPDAQGWTSKLRLPGAPLRRRSAAEAALERAAVHLAAVLSQPPSRYHPQHRAARWGVAVRRAIPLLTTVALTGAVLALPRVSVERTPGLWVLMFHVPVVLIALSFAAQELSRLEVPPLPRPLAGSHWAEPAVPAARGSTRLRWPWSRRARHDHGAVGPGE